MKWLFENKCPWNHWTVIYTIKTGIFENIKWLLENNCPYGPYSISIVTQQHCNIETIEWLIENKYINRNNIFYSV